MGNGTHDARWRIMNGKHRRPQIEALTNAFRALSPGQTISKAAIANAIGEKPDSNGYRTVVQRAKREMEKEFVVLRAVNGEGYERLKGDSQVNALRERTHRGVRAIAKSGVIAAGTPEAELSDEGRKIRLHIAESTAALVEQWNRQRRQLAMNFKQAERLPAN